jgi:hypothetical protein
LDRKGAELAVGGWMSARLNALVDFWIVVLMDKKFLEELIAYFL